MKPKRQRVTKTKEKTVGTLLRLDPKTRSEIDLFAKVAGQSINAYIKDATKARTQQEAKETGLEWERFTERPLVPGYMECLIFDHPRPIFRLNTEDEAIREFVLDYRAFFFVSSKPNAQNLKQLWPHLARYMALTGPGKSINDAARAMTEDLKAVGLPPPAWSPKQVADESDDSGAITNH